MRVKDLSDEELKALIQETVEKVLLEILGDPDQGLEIREDVKIRLKDSLEEKERKGQGIPIESVARKMGLDW